ncbi:MAG: hypothetical protein DWQ06_02065 [Calditrichaeota bacterium]|nr:MAG: hypothetical protein DWQ06_02065 [Calditrichota bacterium]
MEWKDRGWYLVFEFHNTNSKNFDEVLEKAHTLPNFSELVDEKGNLFYRNIFFQDHYEKASGFAEQIKNWKDTRFYLKGNPFDIKETSFFDSCYRSRKPTFADSNFCEKSIVTSSKQKFPDFIGCDAQMKIEVKLPQNYTSDSDIDLDNFWFSFNSTLDYQHFKIQKDKIWDRVLAFTNSYKNCPRFNLQHLEELVYKLPEKIKITENGIWEIRKDISKNRFTLRPQKIDSYENFLEEILGN